MEWSELCGEYLLWLLLGMLSVWGRRSCRWQQIFAANFDGEVTQRWLGSHTPHPKQTHTHIPHHTHTHTHTTMHTHAHTHIQYATYRVLSLLLHHFVRRRKNWVIKLSISNCSEIILFFFQEINFFQFKTLHDSCDALRSSCFSGTSLILHV